MNVIITGIGGQDGYYMAKLLQGRGHNVLGLSSRAGTAIREFPPELFPGLKIEDFDYSRVGMFANVVEAHKPDIIFNFAAMATGKGMFDAPFEMNRINGTFVLDILESIRESGRRDEISFCQASSSEMFGNVEETPQIESTAFRPKSPYGASKMYAHNMVNIYRSVYGLRCCSAILYNHESTRRSEQFVTKKIARYAASIALRLETELPLGNLSVSRDWGYAPEYVEAMYKMATADVVKDYVVATGKLSTIGDLCEIAFGHFELDYRQFVRVSDSDKRAVESVNLHGNSEQILSDLGWRSVRGVNEIMVELVEFEFARLKPKIPSR